MGTDGCEACFASPIRSKKVLNGSHFQSGINFLCAGTIALIFINYNVQLVLSQVPLGSLINRTEIGTASISVLLLQFLLRLFVMFLIPFCMCNKVYVLSNCHLTHKRDQLS